MTQIYSATVSLTAQQVADTIVSAVEGGIAYWASSFQLVSSDHDTRNGVVWYSDPKLYEGDFRIQVQQHEEHEDGAGREVFLTPDAIRTGLAWLASHRPGRIGEIMDESGDANTSDDFVQACVFGKLIYG